MKKTRVLHIINRLNTGGVERWLLGVAEGLQDSDIQVDVLVHTEEPSEFDEAFTATGSKIVKCRYQRDPFSYAWRLYRTLKQNPQYDVIQSHVDHFSGLIMMVAFFAGIKLRICHSHSNRENIEPKSGLRVWYLKLMKRLIYWFGNKFLSVSREAERSLYGHVVPERKREVFYCGLKHLNEVTVNADLKQQLGLPSSSFIVGHVGRLSEPKNHSFILKIFAQLRKSVDATLVLVGDGELRPDIEREIQQLGLGEHVRILGMRSDAVDIMASVFDVMLFPSLYEGLPLTVVEAQVAGVPILVADNITKEAGFTDTLVDYASLDDSLEVWCEKLIKLHRNADNSVAQQRFRDTDFYMPKHLENLQQLYQGY